MEKQKLLQIWKNFTKNKDFQLNPDLEHVEMVLTGVLQNEQRYGLKLCPCRLRDGSKEKDLELICPCNFKTHSTWKEPQENKKSMCWCGLFVKED